MTSPGTTESGSRRTPPLIPTAGVSRRVKVFVVGLTIVTVLAFGVFLALLINKFTGPGPAPVDWSRQSLTVAERLAEEGLPAQAIALYRRYLERENVPLNERALLSARVGRLYFGLGDCAEALSWWYQAEAADPEYPGRASADIASCRKRVQETRRP